MFKASLLNFGWAGSAIKVLPDTRNIARIAPSHFVAYVLIYIFRRTTTNICFYMICLYVFNVPNLNVKTDDSVSKPVSNFCTVRYSFKNFRPPGGQGSLIFLFSFATGHSHSMRWQSFSVRVNGKVLSPATQRLQTMEFHPDGTVYFALPASRQTSVHRGGENVELLQGSPRSLTCSRLSPGWMNQSASTHQLSGVAIDVVPISPFKWRSSLK